MAEEYVTLVDHEIGRAVESSVACFTVEAGRHPGEAAMQCAAFARSHPRALKLRVVCHGIYSNGSPGFTIGPWRIGDSDQPGYGLWLGGQEYLANLMPTVFSFVYNSFDAVVLMVCGAAGRDPAAVPWGPGDGPGLCRAIAASANAPVWASDKEQRYNRPIFGRPVGLSAWRGNVWRFPSDGGVPSLMIRA